MLRDGPSQEEREELNEEKFSPEDNSEQPQDCSNLCPAVCDLQRACLVAPLHTVAALAECGFQEKLMTCSVSHPFCKGSGPEFKRWGE